MGLLARQTINCERIPVGVAIEGEEDRWVGGEGCAREGCYICGRGGRIRGILPRLFFIRVYSRARRFAPVFNITPARSRMFYPLSLSAAPRRHVPSPSSCTGSRWFSYICTKAAGIAPRNEFTILIWRAALAIYYLHGVGEKTGMRCRIREVEGG